MIRSPTPPPVILPFQDQGDGDPHSWYWEEHGGGMRLPAGKHVGKRINELSLAYLIWCHDNVNHPRWAQFHQAFEYYMAGLEALVEEEYGVFIVPLGIKHRGQEIRQCRDKEWFRWLCSQSYLLEMEKYRLFFMAVKKWLANPRKQEVKRDIGEALSATQYTDDLDLRAGDDEGRGYLEGENEDYEWESDDCAFIDDSQQPDAATSESGRSSSYPEDRTAPEALGDADETVLVDTSRKSTPISQNSDDRQPEPDKDEESASHEDSEDGTLESDHEESSKQLSLRSFVEDDTSMNGEDSYYDSDSEMATPLPSGRITRSQMKNERRNDTHQPKVSPSSSKIRSRKRNIILSGQLSETSSVFDDQPLDKYVDKHSDRALENPAVDRDSQKASSTSGNSTQLSLQSSPLTKSHKTRRHPKRVMSEDLSEAGSNTGVRDTTTQTDLDLATQPSTPKPSKVPRRKPARKIGSSDDNSETEDDLVMSAPRLTSPTSQTPRTKDLTIKMSRSSVNSPRRKRETTVYSSEAVSSDEGPSPLKRRRPVSGPDIKRLVY